MDFGDIFGMEGAVEGVDINRTHASPAGALDIVDRMIAHIHAVMAAHAHAGGGPAEDLGIRLVQILVARDHAEIHKRAQGADIQLSITFPSLSFKRSLAPATSLLPVISIFLIDTFVTSICTLKTEIECEHSRKHSTHSDRVTNIG